MIPSPFINIFSLVPTIEVVGVNLKDLELLKQRREITLMYKVYKKYFDPRTRVQNKLFSLNLLVNYYDSKLSGKGIGKYPEMIASKLNLRKCLEKEKRKE